MTIRKLGWLISAALLVFGGAPSFGHDFGGSSNSPPPPPPGPLHGQELHGSFGGGGDGGGELLEPPKS